MKPDATGPPPGSYDADKTVFGNLKSKIDFGNKYKFSVNDVPPPGRYDPMQTQTLPRSRTALMTTEVSPERRPKETSPEPGQYEKHLKAFGEDVTAAVDFGYKYKFVPSPNPPPGYYNPDRAASVTKPRSRMAHLTKETSPYRRPKESSPDPGQYDGHLRPFSQDNKLPNVSFGSKYEFKPNNNPPPGLYNSERADSHTKSRSPSAHIREAVYPHRRPADSSPDPGQYDRHLKAFGEEVHNKMQFGGKYEFKVDGNPPPGYYKDVAKADGLVYPRNDRSVTFVEESTIE